MKKEKNEKIKMAIMPQKLKNVVEKIKENRENNKKIDLGKFVKDVAKKQYEADKSEKEEDKK